MIDFRLLFGWCGVLFLNGVIWIALSAAVAAILEVLI
jgi:hypothetical protein